jgi:hypothetical protein
LESLIKRHYLGHHLYANDTQLIDGARILEIGVTIDCLQQCIEEIHSWCASRRLQLNYSKTEVIWFGTAASLKKLKNANLTVRIGSDVIQPVNVVRDLGVLFDEELSMKQHISKVTSSCFFQLRRLKQVNA